MAVGRNEKLESLKLKSFCLSWKEPSVVGKNRAKSEKTGEVGKFLLKLESFTEVGKFRCSWKVLAEVGKFK